MTIFITIYSASSIVWAFSTFLNLQLTDNKNSVLRVHTLVLHFLCVCGGGLHFLCVCGGGGYGGGGYIMLFLLLWMNREFVL